MNKLYSIITSLSFLFIISCNNPDIDAEVQRIDSLITDLESVKNRILALDTADIYTRLNFQIETLNFIQSESDSLTKKDAFVIDEYTGYKKAYSKWGEKIPIFLDEIELRTNQLNDLKSDANKGALKVEELRNNIDNEENYISALNDITDVMEKGLNHIDTLYFQSKLRVDSIVQNIKQ